MAANQISANATIEWLNDVDIQTTVKSIFGFPEENPTLRQCQTNYRRMSLQVHPDRGGKHNPVFAKKAFQVLTRAFEIARKHADWHVVYASLPNALDHVITESLLFTRELLEFEEELDSDEESEKSDDDEPEAPPLNDSDDDEPEAPLNNDNESEETDETHSTLTSLSATMTAEQTIAANKEKKRKMAAEYRKTYKKKLKVAAKADRIRDAGADASWRPLTLSAGTTLLFEKGHTVDARWQADQFSRAVFADAGAQNGVNVHLKLLEVIVSCPTRACKAGATWARRAKDGSWVCIKANNEHHGNCAGSVSGEKSKAPTSWYMARQLKNCVNATEGRHNLSGRQIAEIINNQGIFKRHPDGRVYRGVKKAIDVEIQGDRDVQMAAPGRILELFEEKGHTARLLTVNGAKMKKVRIAAAKYTFAQRQKGGTVSKEAVFDEEAVDVSDINDDDEYYFGILFRPSYANDIFERLRNSTAADASHCEGKSLQSYGSIANVLGYDCNFNLVPLVWSHVAGNEDKDLWKMVFSEASKIRGFNKKGTFCHVDMEKEIETSLKEKAPDVLPFYDHIHVNKNMFKQLPAGEKAGANAHYKKALSAASPEQVDEVKKKYGRSSGLISASTTISSSTRRARA